MSDALQFDILAESSDGRARVGRVSTPHGSFDTPAFMPVGSRATIRGLTPDQIGATGSQVMLNNAYHLMLRPGDELIRRRGGVHAFMRWDRPILTDSGGYQVFSMGDLNAVDEDGVTFNSIIDGSRIRMTPERAIEVQNNLGADIIMAFDDCPPSVDPQRSNPHQRRLYEVAYGNLRSPEAHRHRLEQAEARTVRWLQRCVAAHGRPHDQALFGIVQGGTDVDLRNRAIEHICNFDLPGFAIGGVAVGEGTAQIRAIVEHTAPRLPRDKPRYLMGVGYEHDLVMAARSGVDMFDCVLPTRNGRNAYAFTPDGPLRLKNAAFREDDGVLEPGCDCAACGPGFTRAYLRHLFISAEMLGPILVSLHNIRYFQRLMLDIRQAIHDDSWSALMERRPRLAAALSNVESSS